MTPNTQQRTPRQPTPAEFEVRIEKLVYGGDGLGRAFGKVVFVPFAVPGDLLQVRAVEQKKNYVRAAIVKILAPGPGRCPPQCPYFGSCGGCQWQHLEYPRQVEAKQQILRELFHHHFPETNDLSIRMLPSPAPYHYRSRTRLQVRGSGPDLKFGYFKFRSQEVEDVHMCPLLRPALNEALGVLRERARSRVQEAVDGQFEAACSEEAHGWAAAGDGLNGASELLRRDVAGFTYWTSPASFFQANDFLAPDLVATVQGFAGGRGDGTALDLYSGVGLFSLPLARERASVTAVEASSLACDLCRRNADAAGFSNVRVVCADVNQWASAVGSVAAPGFELIVMDPPRTGAGAGVMSRIAEWAPETVVYVSCDPQTLVRDLAVLPGRDYRIQAVVGLDMFPQTFHFETVVKLVRR